MRNIVYTITWLFLVCFICFMVAILLDLITSYEDDFEKREQTLLTVHINCK